LLLPDLNSAAFGRLGNANPAPYWSAPTGAAMRGARPAREARRALFYRADAGGNALAPLSLGGRRVNH